MSQRAGGRLLLSRLLPSVLMRADWLHRWLGMRRVRAQLALVSLALAVTGEVYKITPSGTLSIIVGNGSVGSPTPGSATSSHLYQPSGVAVDSTGNVYIADANNSSSRR